MRYRKKFCHCVSINERLKCRIAEPPKHCRIVNDRNRNCRWPRINAHNSPTNRNRSRNIPTACKRAFGFGIIVALPNTCKAANPSELLQLFEGEKRRTAKVAEAGLRRCIQARALELPLPPVAAATAQARDGDIECNDLLTIITILAKSSSRVYLRDKEPNLASIVPGRRLVLIVPKEVTL
jgi:hypothetical protein